ncbi:hypothetical protein OHB49_45450 (plasmid) [Streptomyces sp. NBC_01717]|uniref:hypothetical protein n=1 Tax=Streptomyces sp. NBC_01717 TaxID=2975918 RepID=UPI002E2EB558|nr:hypothetical protein [Streptomyces sp. NBC_01717]
MNVTREHKAAWAAIFMAVLVAFLLLNTGAGLGNMIGAAIITYVVTVIAIAVKMPLDLVKVVAATGRGAIVTAVVVVLLLTSFGRSLAAVIS